MIFKRLLVLSVFLVNISELSADNFRSNSFNNHGTVGLINMPTARLYDESVYGITLYSGDPDTRLTMTSSPFDWLEASFYYTSIEDRPYCDQDFDPVCKQSYKDKGFNFKLRILEEGIFPAVAIGINDLGGTGLYSSEYIVASYGIKNLDFHLGLGWGALNGSNSSLKNPFTYIADRFKIREEFTPDQTGQFSAGSLFSGETVSPFFGISYLHNNKMLFKFERDTTSANGEEYNLFGSSEIGYEIAESNYSYGVDYFLNNSFSLGFSYERGNHISFKFNYKLNPKSTNKKYEYKKSDDISKDENQYTKFIKNLENNGLGVNKIVETTDALGLELTQFIHPNLNTVESIIKSASADAGLTKEVKKNLRVVNLQALSEFDDQFERRAKTIYEREKTRGLNSNNSLSFRPFLASREEFFKGAILLENNTEYIFKDNLIFNSNLKISLADNFDDFKYQPVNTYPAQVRSDVKDYYENFREGVIGRAQFDLFLTPKKNNHIMFTAGILEEMFVGYGMEYLYFESDKNYAFGFEVFDVQKRNYQMRFGLLDYRNTIASANFYYRNYSFLAFDAKVSFGEYLAGDVGSTIDLSRSFSNGVKFGVFASFTDVSDEQFGEGGFDKGIYFNIPIFNNFINYTWKPLTKDPGAKLNRQNTLYDLLVRFRPIN
tara:strand:+ start:321 stop:2303 length:1983 start_codon:yes stop_codon:yes gene_type:complete